jgi:hypothetical protein
MDGNVVRTQQFYGNEAVHLDMGQYNRWVWATFMWLNDRRVSMVSLSLLLLLLKKYPSSVSFVRYTLTEQYLLNYNTFLQRHRKTKLCESPQDCKMICHTLY